MRPKLSFSRSNSLFKKDSIVKDHGKNFVSKNELVSFIQSIDTLNADTALHVKCCCNTLFIYASINDLPEGNVTCDCGQQVIAYGKDSM